MKWWILGILSLGTFMGTLDGSIANVALPSVAGSMNTSLQAVQWVVTAYLLTSAALLPIVGKLSDMFGRGRIYNVGFIVFAFGSALSGLSTSIGMLIGMRVLQAIGASLLMANSQGIVATMFASSERGRALGMIGAMVSRGSLSGSVIGGLLLNALGCVLLNMLAGAVSPWQMAAYMAVFGIGLGMFQPPDMNEVCQATRFTWFFPRQSWGFRSSRDRGIPQRSEDMPRKLLTRHLQTTLDQGGCRPEEDILLSYDG